MSLVKSCTSESLGRFLLGDFRRHTITAAAASMMSRTTAVPAPMAMPIKSAVLSSFLPPEFPSVAPFVTGVLLTAAPVEPVDVVGDPSAPPATFVDPADEDGNIKDVDSVDSGGGIAIGAELTRLVEMAELVGSGTTGGVDWLAVDDVADGLDELDGGGITVKVVNVVGGGTTTVEVGVAAGGGVVGGGGAAVDAWSGSAGARDSYISPVFNLLAAGAGALTVRPGTWIA